MSMALQAHANQVIDSSGHLAMGGDLTHHSASGQPGGVQTAHGPQLIHYAGFLGSAVLQPTLDTDQDGLSNECDYDNDNDSLRDQDELDGFLFNPVTTTDPNLSDTDGDGMNDGDEARAETNPLDPGMKLEITSIQCTNAGNDVKVTWQARGGVNYQVIQLDISTGTTTTMLSNVTALGGLAPWFQTTADFTHGLPANKTNLFYIIEKP